MSSTARPTLSWSVNASPQRNRPCHREGSAARPWPGRADPLEARADPLYSWTWCLSPRAGMTPQHEQCVGDDRAGDGCLHSMYSRTQRRADHQLRQVPSVALSSPPARPGLGRNGLCVTQQRGQRHDREHDSRNSSVCESAEHRRCKHTGTKAAAEHRLWRISLSSRFMIHCPTCRSTGQPDAGFTLRR